MLIRKNYQRRAEQRHPVLEAVSGHADAPVSNRHAHLVLSGRRSAPPGEGADIGGRACGCACGSQRAASLDGEVQATRQVMRKTDFDKLPAKELGQSMDEIVVAAAAIAKAVPARARRSHNTTSDGGPLVNDNQPANAGLPHKGKIGDREATFVRENLQLVNERGSAAGHPPIDPANPLDAKRYGFTAES